MFSRTLIKRCVLLGLSIPAAFYARPASAQITVNFDENGNGQILLPGTTLPLISLGNQTDPLDPNNGLKPLIYDISTSFASLAPIDGDINLLEPQSTTMLSDLIRFEHGLLVVYSELPEIGEPPQLADVGLPINRQMNLITRSETGSEPGLNGLFGYTPGAGDPGDLSAPSIYNFVSDPAVPEPTSLTLVCSSALLLLRRRR